MHSPLLLTVTPQDVPPGHPAWVSAGLIEHTLRVWGRFYPRLLTIDEAVEILTSTGRLLDALARPGNSLQSTAKTISG